jgi:hypothetical protein
VNKSREVSIVFRFDRAEPFSGGLALVEFEGKKRFIDAKRNFAFSKCFADADSFRGELARITIRNRNGFNRSSEIVAMDEP